VWSGKSGNGNGAEVQKLVERGAAFWPALAPLTCSDSCMLMLNTACYPDAALHLCFEPVVVYSFIRLM
jgi:hypothetical protein